MKQSFTLILIGLTLLCTIDLSARENVTNSNSPSAADYSKLMMNCTPSTAISNVDINNMRVYLGTGGDIYYDTFNAFPGVIVPKSGNIASIFAGAMWMGGLDASGNLKIAANTYRQAGEDFWPGPLDNNTGQTDNLVCNAYDRHWLVLKSEIDAFIATGTPTTAIIEWPGKDNVFSPAQLPNGEVMAPFVDVNGDGIYNYQGGDYPDIPGDEAAWFVINDNGNAHTSTGGAALGFQLNIFHYAINTPDLENVQFTDYTIINKSPETINKTYVGTWLDPDLGNFSDDYVGCDTTKNLGICYNADDNDETGYGTDPPFVALKIVNGILGESNQKIGMSSFVYYNNDMTVTGNPDDAADHYGYMTGLWKDDTPITYGGTGYDPASSNETAFMFPDDPSMGAGWSECQAGNLPGDRRFILATGPFTMESGARKSITNAILWDDPVGVYSQGSCPNFNDISTLADEVQTYYDNFIYMDDIPPEITITGGDVLFMNQFEAFLAPDATAVDDQDGDVSSTLNVDQSLLDVNVPNVYNVVYTANDLSGNIGSRILEVVVQEVVGVEDYTNSVSVQPNPMISETQFSFAGIINNFRLIDASGRIMYSDMSINSKDYILKRGNLNSGIYMYSIETEEGEIKSGRLVIN